MCQLKLHIFNFKTVIYQDNDSLIVSAIRNIPINYEWAMNDSRTCFTMDIMNQLLDFIYHFMQK